MQSTSGHFHDESPQWSPDGTSIAFFSDRAHPGRSSAIYLLLPMSNASQTPITDPENQKKITMFKWSPNEQHIAFLSPDEDAATEGYKHAQKGDAIVYGAHLDYNRLRRAHLHTRTTMTLFEKAVHVSLKSYGTRSRISSYTPPSERRSSKILLWSMGSHSSGCP